MHAQLLRFFQSAPLDPRYEFKEICQWFAERCDLILLLFDAHKLDISDEFQKTVEKLKGHEDKIR